MKYFFILGKTPDLSIVEIYELLLQEGSKSEFSLYRPSSQVLIVDSNKELQVNRLMERLGGTIKLGKILKEVKSGQAITPESLAGLILGVSEPGKKVFFGFSQEGKLRPSASSHSGLRASRPRTAGSNENLDSRQARVLTKIKKLGLEVKKVLQDKGISSRFVTSKEKNLSSVVVKKNKLLSSHGTEVIFVIENGKTMIGKTLGVQDFEDYSSRDYMRPARDLRVGMLPPKLAKMMINIAGLKLDETMLDPFCGGGTILQEALLMGYKDVIGGDIEQRMIEGTLTNLDWLKAKQNFFDIDSYYKLYRGDASKLSEIIPKSSIDGIITEPHLGPPLSGKESAKQLLSTVNGLSKLYLSAFQEFKKVLHPRGAVVMIWPVFVFNHSRLSIDILPGVEEIGFESVLGEEAPSLVKTTPRGSLVYSRPGQLVAREIFKFRVKRK